MAAYSGSPAGFLAPETGERLNLKIHSVDPLQTLEIGPYTVTAFPANHDPVVEPLLFAVQEGGRCLFYGADTAALPEETWRGFHARALRFDLVTLDHTYGPDETGDDHLNARQLIQQVARMREEGLLAASARILATHIAHQGNPAHPDLEAFARSHGYEIAYDGLTVAI